MAVTLQDYPARQTEWCPGCGNFGILTAVRRALVSLNLEPYRVLLVSGIGQAGKLPHYTRSNVLNELHGRPIPAATGAKLANPELTVIAISGDGDAYGEGGNHFVHAMNRNVDMTYLVHDNQVYALTKGQTSPTSDPGYTTSTTPQGAWANINPLSLAVATNCSFVARSFAGDIEHLSQMIQQGVEHKGFALIDILQPCVTYNHKNTFSWYRERVYKVEQEGYDPYDRSAAFEKVQEWGDRIPIGVLYKVDRPVYGEKLPALKGVPLAKQPIEPRQFEDLLNSYL